MRIWVYPGSFDPLTLGHEDIISRGAKLCDTLHIAVLNNDAKSPMFSVAERIDFITECTKDIPNVVVSSFDGLLVTYVKNINASAILRGIRSNNDFEYEHSMAQLNKKLDSNIETTLICANPIYQCISSSRVKEIAALGGDIEELVNKSIQKKIKKYFNRRTK